MTRLIFTALRCKLTSDLSSQERELIRRGDTAVRVKVKVKVKVYRSPPITSESPWPEPRSSTSGYEGAEIEASVRCLLTNPRRSTSMQTSPKTSRMQNPILCKLR